MKKQEMTLLRAMDGIDDKMLLDALPEQYGEKRPIRHILRSKYKAVWAAAIAAVIGLNVFAVMQLRGSIRNPGATTVVYPEKLPDLTAFGVDNSFELRESPYVDDDQFDSAYQWYYAGSRPFENWALYENKDGAQLIYDRQGKLRRFFNRPEIAGVRYTDEYDFADTAPLSQTARDFIRTVLPEEAAAADDISLVLSYYGDEGGQFKDLSEISDGWVTIAVTKECEVQLLTVSHENSAPEPPASEKRAIDKAAEKLIKAIAYEGKGDIIAKRYVLINGRYYGAFDVLMGRDDDPEAIASGTYYLLVDPDGILPDRRDIAQTDATEETTHIDTQYPVIGGDQLLTLNDVCALAQKGNALTWEDFAPYRAEDIGSGLYILRYQMDGFELRISGKSMEQKPEEIILFCLFTDLGRRYGIDIRTKDVDAFISQCYEQIATSPAQTGTGQTTQTTTAPHSTEWSGGTTTIPVVGGNKALTLNDVRTLSKKGYALTWSDFDPYRGEAPDCGDYVYYRQYALDGFDLHIGGNSLEQKPEEIVLFCRFTDLDGKYGIDIRTNDVDAFISQCYANTTAAPESTTTTTTTTTLPAPKQAEIPADGVLKWVDGGYEGTDEQYGRYRTEVIRLTESPEYTFAYFEEDHGVLVMRGDTVVKALGGMPLFKVYLSDLNGDGYAEVITEVGWGSGMYDNHIEVYDYHNDKLYALWDRGTWDYTMALSGGEIVVKRFAYNELWLNSKIPDYTAGSMVLKDGALTFVPA